MHDVHFQAGVSARLSGFAFQLNPYPLLKSRTGRERDAKHDSWNQGWLSVPFGNTLGDAAFDRSEFFCARGLCKKKLDSTNAKVGFLAQWGCGYAICKDHEGVAA